MPFHKPSHAWRTGWLLYEGWPAQEGGTDSEHRQRDSHDLLRPAHSFGDAGSSCTPMSDCAARYPD